MCFIHYCIYKQTLVFNMWGNIIMESMFHTNYNFGFPASSSDIILHITQWQYWWWFWFTTLLVLYYFIFLRLFRFRRLKFKPKMTTSYQPHGKWGDVLVCLLPISWCLNILSNSNFILRMIEWQSESSLFNVRIRGKQWYWIYKLETQAVQQVLSTPKEVGVGNWVYYNNSGLTSSASYLYALQDGIAKKFMGIYWDEGISKKTLTFNNQNSIGLQDKLLSNGIVEDRNNPLMLTGKSLDSDYSEFLGPRLPKVKYANAKSVELYFTPFTDFNTNFFKKISELQWPYINFFVGSKDSNTLTQVLVGWTNRFQRPIFHNNMPFRLIKNQYQFNENKDLFSSFFGKRRNSFENKTIKEQTYITIKQKRYVPKLYRYESLPANFVFPTHFEENGLDIREQQTGVGLTNKYEKTTSSPFNKRLLRTRRMLVLPAHVTLGVITNSFDVIHSWYVPGLGLKMDCVPGRSTHHSLYIDHCGFYYGQCAEICGRYHHHMPIRVCALPFEHFLVWWYYYGINYYSSHGALVRAPWRLFSMRQYSW